MLVATAEATDTYQQIRQMVRRFADEVSRPAATALDEEERFPAEIYRRMADLGIFGVTVPEELDGGGLDCYAYAIIIMKEIARGYSSVADQCGLIELIGSLLAQHGSQAQCDRYLARVLRTELLVAYCITEAEAGSGVAGIKSTAARTDDGWRLSGSKLWIHNAAIAA